MALDTFKTSEARPKEAKDDGKVRLHLAEPTPAGLAKLYERLTGKPLSAEGLKRLLEVTTEDT